MRSLAYGALIAVYVLAGRWGFDRLWNAPFEDLDYLPLDADPISWWQLRWILVVIFALLMLFERRRRGQNERIGGQTYAYAQTAFFAYCFLSILWTPAMQFGVIKGVELAITALCSVAIYRMASGPLGPTLRVWFWKLMFWLTAFMAVVAFVKAVQYGADRLAVLGGGPNVFGRMMGYLCLGGLYFWRRSGKIWYIGATVLGILLIVLSGSRGCLIGVVAAIGAFLFVERIPVGKLLGMSSGAAVVMGLILAFTPVGRKAAEIYDERVNRLLIHERYISGRNELYASAWQMTKEFPVFGGGLGSFRGYRYGIYPHNIFLEVLSEEGVVGLILLLLVFWRFERVVWSIRKRADGASVAGFILILVNAQASGDLYDSRSLFVFMALAFIPKEAPAGAPA